MMKLWVYALPDQAPFYENQWWYPSSDGVSKLGKNIDAIILRGLS